MNLMDNSPKYKLNKTDLFSIGKGILLGVAGAFLTAVASYVTQTDFTVYFQEEAYNLTPFVWVVSTALVNAGRKWITGEEAKK